MSTKRRMWLDGKPTDITADSIEAADAKAVDLATKTFGTWTHKEYSVNDGSEDETGKTSIISPLSDDAKLKGES